MKSKYTESVLNTLFFMILSVTPVIASGAETEKASPSQPPATTLTVKDSTPESSVGDFSRLNVTKVGESALDNPLKIGPTEVSFHMTLSGNFNNSHYSGEAVLCKNKRDNKVYLITGSHWQNLKGSPNANPNLFFSPIGTLDTKDTKNALNEITVHLNSGLSLKISKVGVVYSDGTIQTRQVGIYGLSLKDLKEQEASKLFSFRKEKPVKKFFIQDSPELQRYSLVSAEPDDTSDEADEAD